MDRRHKMIHDSWGTTPMGDVARRSIRGFEPMTPAPLSEMEQMIYDIRVLIGEVRVQTAKLGRDSPKPKQPSQ
jgi:hypothetical protein